MHEYLWGLLLLDWHWLAFVILLGLAIVVYLLTRSNNRLWPLGVLSVTGVLYEGVVWHIWSPFAFLFLLFWIVWWLLVVAGVVNLFFGSWRNFTVRRATELIGWVLQGLLGAIVLVTVVTWFFNHVVGTDPELKANDSLFGDPSSFAIAVPDVDEEESSGPDVDESDLPDVDVSEEPDPTDPEPSGEPSGPILGPSVPPSDGPSGDPTTDPAESQCPDVMTDPYIIRTTGSADDFWFAVPSISKADNSTEAFGAFYTWYGRAIGYSGLLLQLDDIVLDGNYTADELVDADGVRTSAAFRLSCELASALNPDAGTTYSAEHEFVLVELENGTAFRVTAESGSIQPIS